MTDDALVSIITPAFQSGRFIADTIRSVQAQTYQNWEMIIVDDCSQDNTPAIVEGYCNQDYRIKLLHNEKNSGPAMTRNNAIKRANGRFMAFLDSDDIWLPEKLDKQITTMLEKKYVFAYADYHRVSEDGTVRGKRIRTPRHLNYSQLLRNTAILTSSVVLDVDAVGKIKMKNTYYDDYACWLEILKRGYVAYGIDEDLVEYRVASSSVSRNKINSAKQVWNTYRNVEGFGRIVSAWCFSGYILNALQKYKKF